MGGMCRSIQHTGTERRERKEFELSRPGKRVYGHRRGVVAYVFSRLSAEWEFQICGPPDAWTLTSCGWCTGVLLPRGAFKVNSRPPVPARLLASVQQVVGSTCRPLSIKQCQTGLRIEKVEKRQRNGANGGKNAGLSPPGYPI